MQDAVCATARTHDVARAQPLLTGRLAVSSACLMAALAFGSASSVHAQTAGTTAGAAQPGTAPATVPQNRATSADLDQAFKQTDANGDGKISREEAVNFPAVLQRFEAIDTDRDSFVSRAELGKAAGA
ncbi:MAG: EF-hand domain-containing protein [Comamonadaceae bacterium]|nr:MAG: EF-hand domain-containing protein [Comamonadaceae bacterium]